METHFEKLKEYLKMDVELPFKEFESYYKEITGFLQKNFETMEQTDLIKAKYIATIVSGNASDRAKRKEKEFKKYRKMAEKSDFWADAIEFRLLQDGMTEEELEAAEEEIVQAV